MKIKMLTISAGPDMSKNWHEGEIRNVDVEEAKSLIEAKVAVAMEPFETAVVKAPEKAVVNTPEKSVVAAPETASKGKGGAGAAKPPVGAPASPVEAPVAETDEQIIAKIATVTKIADLYAFQVEDRSQAVEDAINAKGTELHALELEASKAPVWNK